MHIITNEPHAMAIGYPGIPSVPDIIIGFLNRFKTYIQIMKKVIPNITQFASLAPKPTRGIPCSSGVLSSSSSAQALFMHMCKVKISITNARAHICAIKPSFVNAALPAAATAVPAVPAAAFTFAPASPTFAPAAVLAACNFVAPAASPAVILLKNFAIAVITQGQYNNFANANYLKVRFCII